jgi:predicted transcriptional regulator of viral defense system
MKTKILKSNINSVFEESGGVLRTSEFLKLGYHPRTLYQMRESGEVIELSRGVFRLASLPELENSDLIAVSRRVPNGVICLISALSFYNLTTEIPHEIYVAIIKGKEKPNLDYPPTRFFNFSEETFSIGIEEHNLDGTLVKIYSPEKTIADCFKFRNKIGLDVVIEGLKMCLAKKGSRAKILEFSRICRVENIIRPYLEAI